MQVVVGLEEKSIFYVHENLLRYYSPFFEAALSTSWREGTDGRIKLPDDEPDLLDAYIQFLYSGELLISSISTAASVKCNDEEVVYFVLAQLYALGEKLMDTRFKNEVIGRIFDHAYHTLKYSSSDKRRPTASVVDMIYKSTTAGSPARTLMVDIYFWKGEGDWVLGRPEDNNVEFLTDLTQLLLQRTDRRSKRLIGHTGPDPFDNLFGKRAYQEARTERPTTSKKRKADLSL